MVRNIKSVSFIIVGIICVGMGIRGFLMSSHFIDGGVTGICMLIATGLDVPISILLILVNIPFIVIGYQRLGQAFALKTSIAIAGLALTLAFIPYPDVTPDKFLTALFGGVFIGTGIGLAMRGGAVLDGTEIAALLISRTSPILKVSDAILIMNVIIFTVAVFVLGIEPALYSIVTYFAAARMIDFVLNGIEEYTGVTIISEKSEEVKAMIIEKIGRGVTIYKGKSGHGKRGTHSVEYDIIYTVMTRLEVGTLQHEIDGIDAYAFVIYQSINDIKGGIVKKRAFH